MGSHHNPIHLHLGKPPGHQSVCDPEFWADLIEIEERRLVLVNVGA